MIISMVRLTLMYYTNFIAFMEDHNKTWRDIRIKENQNSPPQPSLFD